MTMKKTRVGLLVAGVVAVFVILIGVRSSWSGGLVPTRNLEGTWEGTVTFSDLPDIPPIKVKITFFPGRGDSLFHNEGTLVDTNEFQLTPNPVCTPDQGTWQRVAEREFIATHYNFCFGAEHGYAPAGPTKIRDTITLGPSGDEFTGTQYVEGFDPEGTLVFVGKATWRGVRVQAEAPPK